MGWGRAVYLELVSYPFVFLAVLDKPRTGLRVFLGFEVTLCSAEHNKTLKEWGTAKELGGFEPEGATGLEISQLPEVREPYNCYLCRWLPKTPRSCSAEILGSPLSCW